MSTTLTRPQSVRFVPSRIEGDWGMVHEVVVLPNELQILADGDCVKIRFSTIGKRQEPMVLSSLKRLVGIEPFRRVVGQRDWCRPPADRFFLWYTTPRLKTYMPTNEARDYGRSLFPQIHQILDAGGFTTFDLA
jgi:hypothetical protein